MIGVLYNFAETRDVSNMFKVSYEFVSWIKMIMTYKYQIIGLDFHIG